jgi:hypothetical protein
MIPDRLKGLACVGPRHYVSVGQEKRMISILKSTAMRISMNKRLIILSISSVVTCAAAHAAKTASINTDTAGELADICGVKRGDPAAATKRTFCQGFAQGAIGVELRHAGQDKPFCFPRPAPSRAETMQQFVAWVGAQPERRLLASTDGLFRFLSGRYPCRASLPSGVARARHPIPPRPSSPVDAPITRPCNA